MSWFLRKPVVNNVNLAMREAYTKACFSLGMSTSKVSKTLIFLLGKPVSAQTVATLVETKKKGGTVELRRL